MDAAEVTALLKHVATERRISASLQNQVLAALRYLYREVLFLNVPWFDGLVPARRPKRLPSVLTRNEVERVRDFVSNTQ
ncbi:MAG: phage integrase N-terminal SAM-like domain-containing protein [Burkholderiales bacterium]